MARRIEIAFAAVFLGWLLFVPRAHAAAYTVAQCGWGVGAEASWVGNSSHFRPVNECSASSPGARSNTVSNGSRTGLGAFARWRWTAPAGSTISSVRGYWRRSIGDGFKQRISRIDQTGARYAIIASDKTDTSADAFSVGVSGTGRAIESILECRRSDKCAQSPIAWASTGRLIFTLRDIGGPQVTTDGPLASGGWLRGSQLVHFSARDDGAGLAARELVVDGDLRRHVPLQCRTVNVEGVTRGSAMQPCQPSHTASETLNTAAFSDGPHAISLCGIDFAGNRGCDAPVEARLDNTAPAAPRGLSIVGGDGWRSSNSFSLGWREAAQGAASPVVAAWYRLRDPEASYDSGPVRVAGSSEGLDEVKVPAVGSYELSTWLEDEAGNVDESHAETVTARFDDVAPVVFFDGPSDPDRPEEISATARDFESGIADGRMLYRQVGTQEWHPLATELGEEQDGERRMASRFPSESLPAGSYELRAEVRDAAGNLSATSLRADGSPMVIRTPLKTDTVLRAALVRGEADGSVLHVAYSEGATVEGQLRSGDGEPVADAPLQIEIQPAAGSTEDSSSRIVHTDGGGRFELVLSRGPSRRILVSYLGTNEFGTSAAAPLQLLSHGGASLSASPRSLRNGRRVTLRGQVGLIGADVPQSGKLVELQFLDRRRNRWQGIGLVRTTTEGDFSFRHRFLRITRRARISFRALVPAESGWPYDAGASRPVVVTIRP